jgi:hypothetical protein
MEGKAGELIFDDAGVGAGAGAAKSAPTTTTALENFEGVM